MWIEDRRTDGQTDGSNNICVVSCSAVRCGAASTTVINTSCKLATSILCCQQNNVKLGCCGIGIGFDCGIWCYLICTPKNEITADTEMKFCNFKYTRTFTQIGAQNQCFVFFPPLSVCIYVSKRTIVESSHTCGDKQVQWKMSFNCMLMMMMKKTKKY